MAFSIKVKPESIKALQGELAKAFQRALKSPQMLNEIGTIAVEDIVQQTRRGRSIPNEGPLKKLSAAWINRRLRLTQNNNPHEAFEPTKSNLTFTGRLLDALIYKVLGPGKIELTFKDENHPGYQTASGEPGNEVPYKELAGYVADGGRPFVGVRPTIRRAINRIVKKFVKRSLAVSRLTKQ